MTRPSLAQPHSDTHTSATAAVLLTLGAGPTGPDTDDDDVLLAALVGLATRILNAHIDDDQLNCAVCRTAYPCRLAVLAALTLSGL